MGVYTNGIMFGIRIYKFIDDDSHTLLERKYEAVMNDEQVKEVYLFYKELDKSNLFFQIYSECSSTYDMGIFMAWNKISTTDFLNNFSSNK
jgi:hypothetical protein